MTDSPSSILGSVSTKFEIRCLEPIIMYLVLSLLSVSLFASNHWCIFSKSTLMRSCSSSFVLPLVEIFVSSANMLAKMRSGSLAGRLYIIRKEVAQD